MTRRVKSVVVRGIAVSRSTPSTMRLTSPWKAVWRGGTGLGRITSRFDVRVEEPTRRVPIVHVNDELANGNLIRSALASNLSPLADQAG